MRRQWVMFSVGVLVGIALCLGCQGYGHWYSSRQAFKNPDTATNLALLWRWAMVSDPEMALKYWSEGRRPYVTEDELDRLAEIVRSSGGAGIERYICLRIGRPDDAATRVILLRVIEPGLIGNRYWEIEDALVFTPTEFDSHILRAQLENEPSK